MCGLFLRGSVRIEGRKMENARIEESLSEMEKAVETVKGW